MDPCNIHTENKGDMRDEFLLLYKQLSDNVLNTTNRSFMNFMIKACSNVYVALSETQNFNAPINYYKVVIGLLNGGVSLRNMRTRGEVFFNRTNSQLMDCSKYRQFWISWKNGHLKLGGGIYLDKYILADWIDQRPFTVSAIGLMTKHGSVGDWKIFDGKSTYCK